MSGTLASAGTYLDDDALVAATTRTQDGLTYYFYELFSPYAKTGAHSYTACTVKVRRGIARRVQLRSNGRCRWGAPGHRR